MNAPITPELRSALESVQLDDKYTLENGRAWMSGIHALVLDGLSISLLGQNYLRHLDSVTINGDKMTLK